MNYSSESYHVNLMRILYSFHTQNWGTSILFFNIYHYFDIIFSSNEESGAMILGLHFWLKITISEILRKESDKLFTYIFDK